MGVCYCSGAAYGEGLAVVVPVGPALPRRIRVCEARAERSWIDTTRRRRSRPRRGRCRAFVGRYHHTQPPWERYLRTPSPDLRAVKRTVPQSYPHVVGVLFCGWCCRVRFVVCSLWWGCLVEGMGGLCLRGCVLIHAVLMWCVGCCCGRCGLSRPALLGQWPPR